MIVRTAQSYPPGNVGFTPAAIVTYKTIGMVKIPIKNGDDLDSLINGKPKIQCHKPSNMRNYGINQVIWVYPI